MSVHGSQQTLAPNPNMLVRGLTGGIMSLRGRTEGVGGGREGGGGWGRAPHLSISIPVIKKAATLYQNFVT